MSGGTGAARLHLTLVTEDPPLEQLVREILETALPSSSVEVMTVAPSAALADSSLRPKPGDDPGPIRDELRRTQRLIAMGKATSRIQHTLNNPLTALMAEAQLLEMEDLSDEHRAAVTRMIELCRRMVAMIRGLDSGTGVMDVSARQ